MTPSITIETHDPQWPALYERERRTITQALGNLLVRIEHIGSTAVPGLGAKPIIDVITGVAREADLDRIVEPLQRIGFEYVPKYETMMPFRRYFRTRPPASTQAVNVHVVVVGSDLWNRHLLFRDYLRSHPEVAAEYERLKRELAPRFEDVNVYAEAKTEFITAVVGRATAERASGTD